MVKKKFSKLSWIIGIIFVLVSIYVILNQGDLSSILVKETATGGDTTLLGKIVLVIVFPVVIFGLTIEGKIPEIFYILLVLVVEFVYGYLIGWGEPGENNYFSGILDEIKIFGE